MRRAFALLACILATQSGYAASVRGMTVVNGTKVHLSDLFRDLGPGQDVEIGDAPALGKTFVVGGPQLTAIAAQFAVDWPDASPLAAVTVVRGTRMVDETAVMPALRDALHIPAEAANVEIALSGFKPVAVPAESPGRIRLTQVSYSPQRSDRFTARLVLGPADNPVEVPLSGTAAVTQIALILRHAIRAGDPVLPDDLQSSVMRAATIPDDAVRTLGEVEGLIARTSLAAGAPVQMSQLAHPALVARGDPVVISYVSDALHVTASGFAMQAGGQSDIVRVFNPATNMVLVARVTDHAQVEIVPGAVPVPADRQGHTMAGSHTLPML